MSVRSSLDKMTIKDTYSLIMFVLFKLREIPEMAPLSQLIYLLDEESFCKLLSYFGGTTVTFPTLDEFQTLIKTLTLYKQVDIDGKSFESAIGDIPKTEQLSILEQYSKVRKIMEGYFVSS